MTVTMVSVAERHGVTARIRSIDIIRGAAMVLKSRRTDWWLSYL